MEIKGQITLLFSDEGMTLELHDSNANTTFVRIKLNQEQTCQVLSRLSHTECEKMEVRGVDKLGKTHECKKFEFELPEGTNWTNQRERVLNIVHSMCPEGWEPDIYFGSKDSFFEKDGKKWARCTIRRWV